MDSKMIDRQGRRANYLRLSLTDACNLSCFYCKSSAEPASSASKEPLTIDEIARLATAASDLGITKIRLTGGEPTLRKDLVAIVQRLSSLKRLRRIAMTTNGITLATMAVDLRKAGLSTLNVSLDSLDEARFARISGSSAKPSTVLAGIDAALDAGFERVSINVVLLADQEQEEREAFFELARKRPLSVRFIELMRTGVNSELFAKNHLGAQTIATMLTKYSFTQEDRPDDAGPARIFRHSDFRGTIGIISPYLAKFCGTCNRLRVDSQGQLHPCLFADKSYPLRELLASDESAPALKRQMALALTVKPIAHSLESDDFTSVASFIKIGG